MTSAPSPDGPPPLPPLRLQQAIDAAELAVWEWDIATQSMHLSARWASLTGQTPAPAVMPMARWLSVVHPDDLGGLRTALEAFVRGQTSRLRTEHRVQTAGGWTWIELRGTITARDTHGRPTQLVGTCADIGERKAEQAALQQAQERAQQANRAKSDFLANMSHEVRTPLNAVIGLARLLRQTPLQPPQDQYLDLMDQSATSLLALLNDMLDLSKIEAGKLVFEQVRFDLLEWVDKAISPFVAQAREKGLQVRLDCDPALPPALVGDPGRLRQILVNLMSNAVKFTHAGGIRVRVWPDADPREIGPGQIRVLFEVRDSGIGMTPEQQNGIFEAFTQADASTTRRYGGTGLGLAICAQLVERMGGRIRVASQAGQGSAFRFSAVFSHAPDDPSQLTLPASLDARSLAGMRVLLAEDHPVNRLITSHMLQELGCTVVTANDGEQALALWAAEAFDLILMDIQMPVLGGEEATARIRAQEARLGGHIPIVALTAHALAGDREKYLAAGMDAYASKPVSPDTLAQALHEALKSRASTPEALLPPMHWGAAPEAGQPAAMPPAAAAPVAAGATTVQGEPTSAAAPSGTDTPGHNAGFDLQRLRTRLGGDADALREVAAAMRDDLDQRLLTLAQALERQDAAAAAAQAHALKGALSSLTFMRGAALARGLELAAGKAAWPLFGQTLALLQHEAQAIRQALDTLA